MANTIRAGRISGDPTKGLCERVCIEVKRVFDGCRETFNNQNLTLEISNVSAQATPPFTYVDAASYGNATFTDIVITDTAGGKSRVSGNINIPVRVVFTDVYDNTYTGDSVISFHREFVLELPSRSVVPYEITVFASFISMMGSFLNERTVAVTGCYTYIVKVVAPVDILVPAYGYAVYPTCIDCREDTCDVFVNLPLFP